MKTRILGLWQLIRPVNVLIGGLSIFIGGFVTGTVHPLRLLLLASASGMAITGGANAINDVYDLAIDRINKPHRPLPAGRVSVGLARMWAIGLFILGTLLGAWVGPLALSIAASTSLLLWAYSAKLKPTPFWGNLVVGGVSGLAFVYGGVAVGRLHVAAVVGGFACLFHIAREIVKDLEDVEGDRAQQARTLPILYGQRRALVLATAMMALVIVATLLPLCGALFGRAYYWVVIPGVDLFLIGVAVALWVRPSRAVFGRVSTLMKADMLVGLLAVYLGRLS